MRKVMCGFGLMMQVLAAGGGEAATFQIDPDPRSPSLGELLDKEQAARAPAAAPVATIEAPGGTSPALPKAASVVSGVRDGRGVRQIYPPSRESAVTVLVPGGR